MTEQAPNFQKFRKSVQPMAELAKGLQANIDRYKNFPLATPRNLSRQKPQRSK